MLTNQPDLSLYTQESSEHEINLCFHYAKELEKYFEGYSIDMEIQKSNYDRDRSDIIVHKRGDNDNNLLIIEAKRPGRNTESDITKIKNNWMDQNGLNYKFGASLILDLDNKKISGTLFYRTPGSSVIQERRI